MIKTVFGCGDRDEVGDCLTPEDYRPDNYPVNMMDTSVDLMDFLMTTPLTTIFLILASKLNI